MNKNIKLQLIASKISQCQKCPELCVERLKTVPGCGNVDSPIVFIGEGPGKHESEQGIPFCGRSGTLLNNILNACGLKREDVFVLNICKCRPPNNRTPTSEEALACRPFLNLQLKVLNPKYLVCLGSCAAQNLLQTEATIGSLRGQWHAYLHMQLMPTWHPSYGLRNKIAKHQIYEDIMKVVEAVKSEI